MAKQLGFFIDVTKCTGCKTCVVACKDAHDLPVGRNFRTVHEFVKGGWKKDADGAWEQDVSACYLSISCNHCSDPACVKVCPVKAHHKRTEDGLVVIDREKCIGCGMCARACPYGAPRLDEKAHKMTKCDACLDRLEKGRQPICVESCPQRAIEFGDIEELRRKHGTLASAGGLPDASVTKPSLVIRMPQKGHAL